MKETAKGKDTTKIPGDRGNKYVAPANPGTRGNCADINVAAINYFGIRPEFAGTSML